jgi:hypothetical protein
VTLDRFALDAYIRLQQQQEALEQLRGDLRDAMNLLRIKTVSVRPVDV